MSEDTHDGGIFRADPIYKQVYQHLRRAIQEGRLQPGDRVIEAQTAASLGISRAPVREAVRKLEQEGLLSVEPGRGAIVVRPALEDIREVYTCRAALEGMAVKLAAELLERSFAKELRGILARLDEAMAARNVELVIQLNNSFHDELVGATGNNLLARLMTSLYDRIVLYRTMAIRDVPVTTQWAQEAHQRIVSAIESGDAEGGRAIAERHVFEVYQALEGHLRAAGRS